jgi:hypothetical protein
VTSVASLIKQSETRYKQKLADETSKVIADNPLAYEYDTLYDDIKAEQDQQRSLKTVKKDVSASLINKCRHHSRDTLSKW